MSLLIRLFQQSKKGSLLWSLYWSYLGSRVSILRYIYKLYKFKFVQFIKINIPKSEYRRYFHCHYNYVDNIQNIVYLNLLSKSMPEVEFIYGINPNQISQVREFVGVRNLSIISIKESPWHSIDMWKNRYNFWQRSYKRYDYYIFYMEFYEYFSKRIHVKNPIRSKYDLMTDNIKSKEILYDVLFVNSKPMSSQFFYDENELNEKIRLLNSHFNIITTRKVEGVQSTSDSSLSLYDIGSLSSQCRCVVAISTGPSWPVLNKINYKNCLPILILCSDELVNFSPCSSVDSSLSHIVDFVNNAVNKEAGNN